LCAWRQQQQLAAGVQGVRVALPGPGGGSAAQQQQQPWQQQVSLLFVRVLYLGFEGQRLQLKSLQEPQY
jgi:hypothetical protein